ncbi:MAG: DNA mismatch repair endonuclease MutL [Lachnospiraceae bacterium]
MGNITLLDQATIDKIAAGEVVERPSSVVKELVENAIDAAATAVTVEIKDGGISLIRISDNGCGIAPEDVKTAFLRHSTSKIRSVEDLMTIRSLGFRGEALSSIAAVSMVELLTKQSTDICGTRYVIEGSREKCMEEAASPDGTTFFVRNIFYNTPARKKFLKSAMTEAGYIHELMIRMALSHPEISFKFISNGQTKLHSSGNHQLKDVIYQIYGREITRNLQEIHAETDGVKIEGYIGKPNVFRGNRNFETYFINGRYIRSGIIAKAIEDAYKGFLMQHQYPFCVLHFSMDGSTLDVNVHPTKMELRFANQPELYQTVYRTVREGLEHKEYIPEVSLEKPKETPKEIPKETPKEKPKEKNLDYFLEQMRERVKAEHASRPNPGPYQQKYPSKSVRSNPEASQIREERIYETKRSEEMQQLELFEKKLLDEQNMKEHKIIGQLFETYWLVEFDDKLFMIDQHAAHEKVLYERTLKELKNKEHTSQLLSPPMVVSLSPQEEELLKKYMGQFTELGYEIEHFGGSEYQICAVPANLYNIGKKELFMEMLGELGELSDRSNADLILERIASMSCKAAVKGNQKLSGMEAEALIKELLTLENPYRCPHGRPTIISMSKYEIEKKFKRIV